MRKILSVDIVTKTNRWQDRQRRKLEENEVMILVSQYAHFKQALKMEREYKGCTFYPNGIIGEERIRDVNPRGFYERSTKWRRRINAANSEREKEIYSQIIVLLWSRSMVKSN